MAFLSCDARDMCRLGPALVRNYLVFFAASLRLLLLFLGFALDFYGVSGRIAADVYWSSRTSHPDYPRLVELVDEADEVRATLRNRSLDDGERLRARSLAARIVALDRAPGPNGPLGSDGFSESLEGPSCEPFTLERETLYVLVEELSARRESYGCSYEDLML